MKITRRQFMKAAAAAGVAASAPGLIFRPTDAHAYAVSQSLPKFLDDLPRFGTAQIPLATPDTTTYPGIDYYQIKFGPFTQQLHSSLPATRLYGYANLNGAHAHLGGAILAKKGKPVRIKFTNNLPGTHILPYDSTVPNMDLSAPTRPDRGAIHLHGGLVPWPSDGGPFHWFTNANNVGGAALGSSILSLAPGWLPDAAGNFTDDYLYPNHQSARFMWYHDHAVGITRLNAYAGLATGYLVTDDLETTLWNNGNGLPSIFQGSGNDIPMVFQDKVFWTGTGGIDPTYATHAPGAVAGDLWYPWFYDPLIWKLQGRGKAPVPSAVPEMFGDTMLVNGHVYPKMTVGKGKYRFRWLNACNGRFLNLKFVYEQTGGAGFTGEPSNGYLNPNVAPVDVWLIGTEGGFLQTAPVQVLVQGQLAAVNPLLLAPAERVDIVVDFSAVPVGQNVILYNDAPAPYPIGAPIFDIYPGAVGAPATTAGNGPNTRTIMRFEVTSTPGPSFTVGALRPTTDFFVTPLDNLGNGGLTLMADGGNTNPATFVIGTTAFTVGGKTYTWGGFQNLTLNEAFDAFGRLMQEIGTTVKLKGKGGATFGKTYLDPPTEIVKYGTVQIWNIFNLTADTHPMHFHLFNVMVLRRRMFKVQNFSGVPVWIGPGRLPDATEMFAWKETVKMWPGECTTVAVLVENPFDLPLQAGVSGNPTARSYTFNAALAAQVAVNNATGAAGAVTLTTAASHGLVAGDFVYTSGVGFVSDGPYQITTVTDQNNVVIDAPLSGGAFTPGGTLAKVVSKTGTVPASPRLAALPIPVTGDEYVWHCHILEHEEHDMMRPLVGTSV